MACVFYVPISLSRRQLRLALARALTHDTIESSTGLHYCAPQWVAYLAFVLRSSSSTITHTYIGICIYTCARVQKMSRRVQQLVESLQALRLGKFGELYNTEHTRHLFAHSVWSRWSVEGEVLEERESERDERSAYRVVSLALTARHVIGIHIPYTSYYRLLYYT